MVCRRAVFRTACARGHAEKSSESCKGIDLQHMSIHLHNILFPNATDFKGNAVRFGVLLPFPATTLETWMDQMASQPSDDANSRDRISKQAEKTSDTIETISSFVDGDHIAEIMRMQQSV